HEVHALRLADHARMVAPHGSHADEPDPEVTPLDPLLHLLVHHAPAFVAASTAVTIRSRSPSPSDGCTGSEMTCCAARSVSGSSRSGANTARDSSRWLGIG